jgi:DNA-binding CsgD family transcriptional regulator
MLGEKFYKEHITFTAAQAMQALIKPLHAIGINYFTYDKNYDDGTHLRLTTHGHWIESYYRQEIYNGAVFEKDLRLFGNGYVFWSWLNREPVYSVAAEHDIDHGITIIQKQPTSCDFYHFGTSRDNYLSPEKLFENLNLLYRFIDFFREQAATIIDTAEKTRIRLPNLRSEHIKLPSLETFPTQAAFAEFLQKTEVQRLYLGEKFNNAYLTRREIDIVRMLLTGKRAIAISQELSVSDRTLEVHMSHIKDKFKCNNLFELGFLLGSLGPKSLYPIQIPETNEREGD